MGSCSSRQDEEASAPAAPAAEPADEKVSAPAAPTAEPAAEKVSAPATPEAEPAAANAASSAVDPSQVVFETEPLLVRLVSAHNLPAHDLLSESDVYVVRAITISTWHSSDLVSLHCSPPTGGKLGGRWSGDS